MASNQTQNYGLSQWELTDDVRMEDFNLDNAKIDAALMGRYGPGNPGWVIGKYIGDDSTSTREIALGFRPSAVIIAGVGAGSGFMVSNGTQSGSLSSFKTSSTSPTYVSADCISITEQGFSVRKESGFALSINDSGKTYLYIAFP